MPSARSIRFAAFATLFAGAFAYALMARAGAAGAEELRMAVEAGALFLLVWRTATATKLRAAWALMTLANFAWAGADLVTSGLLDGAGIGLAGPLYLVSYAFAYAMLIALLREQAIRPWRAFLVLDGCIAGLTVAAVFLAVLHAIDASALGGPAVRNLACDVLLLVTVTLGIALRGWRPGWGWWLVAFAQVGGAVLDGALIVHPPADIATPGWLCQSGWLFAFVIYALATWQPVARRTVVPEGWSSVAVPLTAAAIALGLLVHGDGGAAALLAGAALCAGWVRTLLLFSENRRLLDVARSDATTDKLTGLPNRRALITELEGAVGDTLVFFDLDGFKEYNDAFGHHAGDALLQRQAPRLAAVSRAYRLGGDEFCILLDGERDERDPLVRAAVEALSEHGDGFEIGASFGLVVLEGDPAEALRVADERMYARKRRRRAGQAGPARDVLLQVLAERNAENRRVTALAAATGRRLGLDAEELDVLVRAAELHDVGKVAIPDAILAKAGPLDAAEWAVLRQHPIAGERILAVAESMRPVARLVRSTYERWDGQGYPDGLAGEAIPLGARIIAACEAGPEELRAGAGTRFDPAVAEVVADVAANLDTVVSG